MHRFTWTVLWLGTWLAAGANLSLADTRPRLVVVVSIDQFPYEYLVRMRGGFDPKGLFLRLLEEGTVFTNCHHAHAFTYTAPGHSVLLTGASPSTTGIVDNEWFDRAAGKKVYCVHDDREQVVGGTGVASSPRTLLCGTLGDSLQAVHPEAKVFGVALKDRAAILMAGLRPDGAYWFDDKQGRWVTSTYYRPDLPGYLRQWNEERQIEAFAGQRWDLLLSRDRYVEYYPDDAKFESAALGRAFPHVMPAAGEAGFYDRVTRSPFGNDITLDAARRIIEHERLGQDAIPDLLVINLSSNDYVGHGYGPHSLEVQDITYRTDRQLGALADFITERLAGQPWVLALSSDHGVGPVPEYAAERGLPALRNPLGPLDAHSAAIEARLVRALGQPERPYVLSFDYGDVYLRAEQLPGEKYFTAQKIVRDYVLEQPSVAAAFTRDELLAGGASDALAVKFQRTFHPRRSGDVLFCLRPYCISGSAPATHGSPWEYDAHVPLCLWGAGIPAQHSSAAASPSNLAPTLARLLQIEPPTSTTFEALPLSK